MGDVADGFSSVWRQFNTDGMPGTGEHDPTKAEARALGGTIEEYVTDAIDEAALPPGTEGQYLRVHDGVPGWRNLEIPHYFGGIISFTPGTPTGWVDHGLGGLPAIVTLTLTCIDEGGEHGYSQADSAMPVGATAQWNATQMRAIPDAGGVQVLNASGALSTVTPSKWRFRLWPFFNADDI
jgi:hypothetical protein